MRTLIFTAALLASATAYAQNPTLPDAPTQNGCASNTSSSLPESSGCFPATFTPADGGPPRPVLMPSMYVFQQGGSAPVPPAAVKSRELQIGAFGSYVDPDYGPSVNVDVGVYVAFTAKNLGVEADAADTVDSRGGIHEAYAVIGPRAQMKFKMVTLYVKAQAGAGRFSGATSDPINNHTIGAVEQYGGGLEMNLSRHVKVRLADYTYQVWPEFSVANLTPYHVSSGLAMRF